MSEDSPLSAVEADGYPRGHDKEGEMLCFECGEPAVALCRWCFRGQCAKHLEEGLAARSRQPTMGCIHEQPEYMSARVAGAQGRTHSEQPATKVNS